MFANDLMTIDVACVNAEASLERAIRLMLDRNVSGLPVLDDAGDVCGIITEGDLLNRHDFRSGRETDGPQTSAAFFETYVKQHGQVVQDCMTVNVVSAAPETTLAEIASLMRRHNIKRIPILANGRLAGIVSRRDIMKAVSVRSDTIAPGDDALRLAVLTRLQVELGFGSDRVDVDVRNAVVMVTGEFETEMACEAVRIVTENIAGARSVVARRPLA